jgi:hypothetical protein
MERYFNNYQTTIANGGAGYVAGSGVLNVLSTSGITLNAGDTARLSIYTGSPELVVILIASAVNSATQFAVTAEGSDLNANDGDLVLNTLTAGGMDQIRSDICMVGTRANLPSPLSAFLVTGQRYVCTDCPYEFIYNGSAWDAFVFGFAVTEPILSSFTEVNISGNTDITIDASHGGIAFNVASAGGNQNVGYLASAVPGSGGYYVDTAWYGMPTSANGTNGGFGGVGLSGGVSASASKFAVLSLGWENSGIFGLFEKEYNSTTSFNTNNANAQYLFFGPLVWMRVHDDGTTYRTWYISPNGQDWFQIYQQNRTTNFTPAYGIVGPLNYNLDMIAHLVHFSIHT